MRFEGDFTAALFSPMHDRFVKTVESFVAKNAIPVVRFQSGQRKDDIVAGYRSRFSKREGVVVLGIAQEKMRSFKAQKRRTQSDTTKHRLHINAS